MILAAHLTALATLFVTLYALSLRTITRRQRKAKQLVVRH